MPKDTPFGFTSKHVKKVNRCSVQIKIIDMPGHDNPSFDLTTLN